MSLTRSQLEQQLERCDALCRERGVRLTAQRRRVLELLYGNDQPMGAYEILDQLRGDMRKVAPPTVYRALDFLLEQGFIHRLATLHAFVACEHLDHPHTSQFLICNACGEVAELEDEGITRSLKAAARAHGFRPEGRVVEITGLCARCAEQS